MPNPTVPLAIHPFPQKGVLTSKNCELPGSITVGYPSNSWASCKLHGVVVY